MRTWSGIAPPPSPCRRRRLPRPPVRARAQDRPGRLARWIRVREAAANHRDLLHARARARPRLRGELPPCCLPTPRLQSCSAHARPQHVCMYAGDPVAASPADLVAENVAGAVADGAGRDAAAPEHLLVRDAQPLGQRARRHDNAVRPHLEARPPQHCNRHARPARTCSRHLFPDTREAVGRPWTEARAGAPRAARRSAARAGQRAGAAAHLGFGAAHEERALAQVHALHVLRQQLRTPALRLARRTKSLFKPS
jgi:hypothetical protein